MKIIVVFTGGTIGSRVDASGYISTKEAAPYQLLAPYAQDQELEFITHEPYCILSENLTGDYLVRLAQEMEANLQLAKKDPEIAGIIICHGTDSLQYSAAFLQYLFGGASIPTVLVSSAYVLDDPRANGPANFRGAVDWIRYCRSAHLESGNGSADKDADRSKNRGVFVSYQNQGQPVTIHRGSRLRLPVLYSDVVTSVSDKWIAQVDPEGTINLRDAAYPCDALGEEMGNVSLSQLPIEIARLQLSEDTSYICRLRVSPGMAYPDLTAGKYQAITIETYHSGTICVDDRLRSFTQQAKQFGVPIYLIGLDTSVTYYETVKVYDELGILPLVGTAAVAQYCKLWLLCSNGLDVQKYMAMDCAQERSI